MSRSLQLDRECQPAYLAEAADRFLPAVVTCQLADGWSTLRSRFLNVDTPQRQVTIEYPSEPGLVMPEIVPGQNIGVSFRRGHKKCVFNAIVLGQGRFALSAGRQVPSLILDWPQEMFELQRRLYYRAAAPEGMAFPVQVWPGEGERPPQAERACWGTVVDLSAGGISIRLDRDEPPPWQAGQQVTCLLAPDPQAPPIAIGGRLCHMTRSGGSVSLGVHFVGLDSRPELHDTFRQVVSITARFQRAEMHRCRRP